MHRRTLHIWTRFLLRKFTFKTSVFRSKYTIFVRKESIISFIPYPFNSSHSINNQLVWGHHTTFTLVFPLFEIIISIFFIEFVFPPSRFEKTEKKTKLKNIKNLRININFRFFDFSQNLVVLLLASRVSIPKLCDFP